MSASRDQLVIEERWRRLDPIFIMGRQRTGTSIMWRVLRATKFFGFNEGHLWFEMIEPFAHFRDPEHEKWLRQDIFTLGSSRNLALEKRFALMVDQFHRDLLPPELVRWVDKSPGVYPVQLAPMLAEIFPRAQFIFMKRNAITTVNSTINYISQERDVETFRLTSEDWVEVMKTWRQVRHLLVGRYVEVSQEQIAEKPGLVASQVANFLRVPQFARDFADGFKSQRENTAFPDKDVGEYIYPIDWTDEQRIMLTDICREEMQVWGYPLDFQCPGGIDPTQAIADGELEPMDMEMYYRWVDRTLTLERKKKLAQNEKSLAHYKELLARINEGRVMRVLNGMDRILRRLGLR